MPTYQYQCSSCGHELEEFQSMSEAPLTLCPECQQTTLLRVMGAGAGLIFKGSGFYLTDYKKNPSPAAPAAKTKGDGGTQAGSSSGSSAGTPPPAEKK